MLGSTLTRRAGVAVAVVATAALLPTGVAQAAPKSHCATLIGAQTDTAGQPVVLKRTCSTSSAAAAAAMPAASTKLMTWYSEAGFRGTSADIYGSYGICDSAGYTFTPNYVWQLQMSSIRGYGACDRVHLSDHSGHGATFALSLSFGSTIYNDDVSRINVYCGWC